MSANLKFENSTTIASQEGQQRNYKEEGFAGPVIRYDLLRLNKPLSKITAADVPPGFDPEDVASDCSD